MQEQEIKEESNETDSESSLTASNITGTVASVKASARTRKSSIQVSNFEKNSNDSNDFVNEINNSQAKIEPIILEEKVSLD